MKLHIENLTEKLEYLVAANQLLDTKVAEQDEKLDALHNKCKNFSMLEQELKMRDEQFSQL